MRIPCPHCGLRGEEEFSYGGVAGRLPALDGLSGPEEWHEAVHMRLNSKSDVQELWYHASGCERWLLATRSPSTHAISHVCDARDDGERS
ncbi:MAG: sarcosine oxidase subunit delta [Rhodobacteraceae bacterium]|nr:sarcosine oxidase subunit delta [Paracoccaceae bacterium]